ncbi:MAG: DinB family protein [Chloroflexota bacterium]
MQPYPVLETIYHHNLWANLTLLEVCMTLSDEQLRTSAVGGYGSILDTLQHFVTSEESYIYRIRTGEPLIHPKDEPVLSMTEMRDSLKASGEGLIEWASKIEPTDFVEIPWKDGELVQVPKAIILNQAINHATEHREQITAILTRLGIEPPELSSWEYFDSQGLP